MTSRLEENMRNGHASLKKGRRKRALQYFLAACVLSEAINHPSVDAYHMSGICYRLHKNYDLADSAFITAFKVAGEHGDEVHQARILRDWAMVDIGRGQFEKASQRLEDSRKILEDAKVKKEYWATMSFIGHLHACTGDSAVAYQYTKQADAEFRCRYPTYELNNLMRLMRVAAVSELPLIVRRIYRLAKRAKNWRRRGEIVMILGRRIIAFFRR